MSITEAMPPPRFSPPTFLFFSILQELKDVGAGVYVLTSDSQWDGNGDPYQFEIRTRFYSPCALGTCIDFELSWFMKVGAYEVENWARVKMVSCTADCCNPSAPLIPACRGKRKGKNIGVLLSSDLQREEYRNRSLATKPNLVAACEALFGREEVMSERKMWALLASASVKVGVDDVNSDMEDLFRLSRRQWKLAEGESGDGSEEDEDSGNDQMEKERRNKRRRKESKNSSGLGLGGGASFSEEESDGEDSDESWW